MVINFIKWYSLKTIKESYGSCFVRLVFVMMIDLLLTDIFCLYFYHSWKLLQLKLNRFYLVGLFEGIIILTAREVPIPLEVIQCAKIN